MMKHLTTLLTPTLTATLAATLALVLAPAAGAAAVITTYPDQAGQTVEFSNMQESDLPGGSGQYLSLTTPTSPTDALSFVGSAFTASGANNSDNPIEGLFQADIQGLTSGPSVNSIAQIVFRTFGDYNVYSAGSSAHVVTTAHITATAVNGQALAAPVSFDQTIFTGDFTAGFGQSWDSGQVAVALADPAIQGVVTAASISLDTKIWTGGQGLALIHEKGAEITVQPGDTIVVPVPAAAGISLLAGLMLTLLLIARPRRQSA